MSISQVRSRSAKALIAAATLGLGNIASIACADATVDPSVEAPGSPSVQATAVSSSRIDLVIVPGARADTHSVHVSTTPGFTVTLQNVWAALDDQPSTFVIDTGLQPLTTYYGRVVALNRGGAALSDEWSATTLDEGAPPPPPPPPPEGVWFAEHWDYPSTTAMKAAAYSLVEQDGGTVSLQTSGVEGGLSAVGNALRAQYSTSVHSTASLSIRPPDWNVVRPREVWVEIMIRFNASWNIDSDDKTFFYMEDRSAAGGASETARWETHIVRPDKWYGGPSGALGIGIPDFFIYEGAPIDPWDGNWHRFRQHLRMSSTATATDGAYRVWWDDQSVLNESGFATGSPVGAYFRNLIFGRNADPKGSGVRDWGRVLVYASDPGW